jgi:hypothetical protein
MIWLILIGAAIFLLSTSGGTEAETSVLGVTSPILNTATPPNYTPPNYTPTIAGEAPVKPVINEPVSTSVLDFYSPILQSIIKEGRESVINQT